MGIYYVGLQLYLPDTQITDSLGTGVDRKRKQMVIALPIQGLSITMADRNYTVSGEEPLVHLQVKPSPLNLVLDIDIPGRLNLTLVWNKHMSVSIKIRRATQVRTARLPANHGSQLVSGEGFPMKPTWLPINCSHRMPSVACVATPMGT